jgi:ABC-type multidrug transport system fused ATPase/permease subunit
MSFLSPVTKLISVGQTLQEMRTQMERIEDVMEYPTDVNYENDVVEDGKGYNKLSGKVELKDVTFGYSPLGKPLIEHLDISMEPGSRVALVGSSGCGKSTISRLISGLYQPWSGQILFDGKPASAIDRTVFTGSLAVVDQDIILFEDTIANNIRFGQPDAPMEKVVDAAKKACCHDFIMQLPDGYDTVIGEGGASLSGGEKQRISIARAIMKDAPIIVLDEATANVDPENEADLMKAIDALTREKTIIMIAHRLKTVRHADQIIVIDGGQIAQQGTHDELMQSDGIYRRFVESRREAASWRL